MDLYLWSMLCHHCIYPFLPQLQNLVLSWPPHDHLHCLVPHSCLSPSRPGNNNLDLQINNHIYYSYCDLWIIMFLSGYYNNMRSWCYYIWLCRWKELSIRARPNWFYILRGPQTFSTHLGDMPLLCKADISSHIYIWYVSFTFWQIKVPCFFPPSWILASVGRIYANKCCQWNNSCIILFHSNWVYYANIFSNC